MGRARQRLAVVGAGVAGCAAAEALARAGHAVTLVDKGRIPGGRLASKRLETRPGMISAGMVTGLMVTGAIGAQFATAESPAFSARLGSLAARGLAATWHPRGLDDGRSRFVGLPDMAALVGDAGEAARLHTGTRVTALARTAAGWMLATDRGALGPFAAVLVTAPAPQAAALLEPVAPALAAAAAAAVLSPCWAALLWFEDRLEPGFDAAAPGDPAAAWVAREGSRPGRLLPGDLWVVQAGPDWSAARLEDAPDAVAADIEAAFGKLVPTRHAAAARRAHRWRHALVVRPAASGTLADQGLGLAAAGDWLRGPGIEAAFLSGDAAGQAMAGWFA